MIIATVIALIVAAWTAVRFALGTLRLRATLLDRDRLRVLTRGVEAVIVLFLVRSFADWTLLTIVPWLVLVAVVAAGAAGAVLRWPALPWLEDPARSRTRALGFAGTLALSAAFVGVIGL
ncbi:MULTISPECIES: hypothetical protein [unclassified Rathayibacter]|uniref:hypothetical protein n=1 Tax=unclassified Rathayibacter TaxID=2609250 RepID=UPI0006F21642|nr:MULTISPECIES: hypothetical protein [unclassified Rathayibacter]KQQ06266.1 hypothetical protein ASF42_07080 [Rathayibacter sp. Leaf294]KQS14121.1 hypothetical protein ASG06_07080 [Rathayibacter sp. Leaf185]